MQQHTTKNMKKKRLNPFVLSRLRLRGEFTGSSGERPRLG